eukprot:scaffold1709_cov151-Skeletonema_menzelii.AAC.5
MQWFCRMNAAAGSQNRIPPKRSSLHQCRCRLKTTLMLVLLSAYCISSLHAHRRSSSSSPSFLRHAQKSVISAFVTNENDVAIIRRQKHHSQVSSTISKNESILYRTQLIATTTVTRQSSSSPSLSLLLMASSTTSSSSSSAETQPTNNNRQQLPQSPPLVSKSKIESQIEQLENQQNVQKKKQLQQQQQQQRYPKKKGTESPSTSSSTLSSTKKRSSTKKNQQQQQQHHHRTNNNKKQQRCSIPQNKKRQVRYLYTKAKQLEKRGLWREASNMYERIVTELQPNDAHSYLAWGRLESRRERGVGGGVVGRRGSKDHHDDDDNGVDDDTTKDETSMRTNNSSSSSSSSSSKASTIFQTGTKHCPNSTHLYHGWAIHEQYTLHNTSKARSLLQTALTLDPNNGYVCHAYGLLEHTMGEVAKAKSLWQQGLVYQPSAALVCSLGEMYVASGDFYSARELYSTYLSKLSKGRERTEVYLAAASLEERVYNDVEKASELLRRACSEGGSVGERGGGGAIMDGRAYVALAKLGTSRGLVNDKVVKKRLKEICMRQLNYHEDKKRGKTADNSDDGKRKAKNKIIFPVNDGRLFNAWAKMESKSGNLSEARKILGRGMELYPNDYTLLQAAGNIEERLGNTGSARKLYAASLAIEPSAPALIAYALLELRSPIDAMTKVSNVTMVRKLFEEALLIDPKHGPAYNAFGNLERRQGNTAYARQIYENGIKANCTDAPSVYHGLAKLHLSLGEVEEARNVLQRGLALFPTLENNTLVQRNENVAFLAHTLAMIDLNVNNNAKHAKEVLQQGLWHCRNSPQLLLGMALCESRLGNDNGARDMFEKSLMADQTHAQAWQAFGVMEMRAGNFRSAKLLFECGLKNSPTHGALWLAYGKSFLIKRTLHYEVMKSFFPRLIDRCRGQ